MPENPPKIIRAANAPVKNAGLENDLNTCEVVKQKYGKHETPIKIIVRVVRFYVVAKIFDH